MKPTVGRPSSGKLPKPKAKDPNKRAMSMDENPKLSVELQSLPEEKMAQLVHIIRKRNAHMVQEGDEIELDIEVLDRETLWEFDRFVTNWKKMVSKAKRQALMANSNLASILAESETASGEDNVVSASERAEALKKPVEREVIDDDVGAGDNMGVCDDVDIGECEPMSSFAPVEVDNDDGGGGPNENDRGGAASSGSSSSGSSSSDSSSSNDSDLGSSSGTDSAADDAQSKGVEAQDPTHANA